MGAGRLRVTPRAWRGLVSAGDVSAEARGWGRGGPALPGSGPSSGHRGLAAGCPLCDALRCPWSFSA